MRTLSLLLASLALAACTPPDPTNDGDTSGTDDSGLGDTDPEDTDPEDSGEPREIVLLSSGGGGSSETPFVGEYVEEECPTECTASTAPTLGEPEMIVNGLSFTSPAPVAGDAVAIAIAYADAECDLACGALYYSWASPTESEGSAGSLPSNLPCGTEAGGVYLGFDFRAVEPGDYTWELRIEDACGNQSERISGAFTVPA